MYCPAYSIWLVQSYKCCCTRCSINPKLTPHTAKIDIMRAKMQEHITGIIPAVDKSVLLHSLKKSAQVKKKVKTEKIDINGARKKTRYH